MVQFEVDAINAAGQQIHATIEATSAEEALAQVRNTGAYPTRVREGPRSKRPLAKTRSAKPKSIASLSLGRIPTRHLTDFTQQLSTLQDAGLPIVRSLRILTEQQKGPLKSIITTLANDVEDGSTLSEAMARHPKAFDRLYVNMVQAGEAGGVLDVILQRLAEFMDKSQRLKRRILGAMIYPAVVIVFSTLIVTGIMVFVIPRFRDIFKDFHTTLPALTQTLIDTSDFIANQYGWLLILGFPFFLLGTLKLTRRLPAGRRLLDTVKISLPILGQLAAKSAIARFTRTLGTLLAAGVPILDALKITRDTVGNVVYESALQKVHEALREGEPFAPTLRATRCVDSIVSNMIDVGEETGDLDKMLTKIADNYDDQVNILVASLVSLIEPLMVVVLGGIVGTIVVALFLPLVNIMRTLTGDTGSS